MKLDFNFFIIILLLTGLVSAEDFKITEEQLEEGYIERVSPGDKIIFPFDEGEEFVEIGDVYEDTLHIGSSKGGGFSLYLDEESPEWKQGYLEFNYDWTYDISVKLKSTMWVTGLIAEKRKNSAMIVIRKSTKEVDPNYPPPYSCQEFYTCPKGTKGEGTKKPYCELLEWDRGAGCRCTPKERLCPTIFDNSCVLLYNCSSGIEINSCTGDYHSGCVCWDDPEPLCEVKVRADYGSYIVYDGENLIERKDGKDYTVLKADCEKREGNFSECGSPCDPKSKSACAAVCVPACTLKQKEGSPKEKSREKRREEVGKNISLILDKRGENHESYEINISSNNESNIYRVEQVRPGRLFWVFPVNVKVAWKYDIQEKTLRKIEKTWWAFLVDE